MGCGDEGKSMRPRAMSDVLKLERANYLHNQTADYCHRWHASIIIIFTGLQRTGAKLQ